MSDTVTTAPTPAAPTAPAAPTPEAPKPAATPSLAEALASLRQHPSAFQSRDDDGRFAAEGAEDEYDARNAEIAEGAVQADGAPAVPGSVGDPNAVPNTEPAPEGEDAPAPEGDGEPEAPAAERVALPARNAGEPDVEIEVSDPAVAERLRQLKNGFLRGEEVKSQKADIRQAQAELAEVRDLMAGDPVGFVKGEIPRQYHGVLALQLLRDPEVRTAVQEHLEGLLDPDRLPLVEAQLKALEYETREQTQRVSAQRREATSRAALIQDALGDVLQNDRLTNDCLADVIRMVRQGAPAADAAQLTLMIAPRLRDAGLDPLQVSEALHQRMQASGTTAPAAPTPAAAKRPVVTAKAVQPTGKDFVAGRERRQQAAAAAPPGQVAPAAGGLDVPADARLEDSLRLLKERTRR